ncbi:MAG: 50S ribosomal protein L23 [Planctomycetes bacterium]|nr:50S ribosomal protein L23 [Planctomycetota bacterium]
MQTRPRPKKYIRYNRKARPVVEGKPNLELRPYQVLIRPLVTEKGTHESLHHNAYTFRVNPNATKLDIKNAVQELFNVRVLDVRTQIRHGKKRRYRTRMGEMSDWKRAVVKLHDEDKIEFF